MQRIQICHSIFENKANFADRFPLLKPHHLRLQAALSTNLPFSTPSRWDKETLPASPLEGLESSNGKNRKNNTMLDEQKNMFYVGWDANLPVGKKKKRGRLWKTLLCTDVAKGIV